MCGCNKSYRGSNVNYKSTPTVTNGTNQLLLKQISDQQRQQQAIQQVIQKSSNPTKTLIKTYR